MISAYDRPAIICGVLKRGSNFQDGKYRIYEQFLKNESADSNINFLKKEYGDGGCYPAATINGIDYNEEHNAKGIRITQYRDRDHDEMFFSWQAIETIIKQLVRNNKYLSENEIVNYPIYKANQDSENAWRAVSDKFRCILNDFEKYVEKSGLKIDLIKFQRWHYISALGAFVSGDKKFFSWHSEGDDAIIYLRNSMYYIIEHCDSLAERCEEMIEILDGNITNPLADESNKNYIISRPTDEESDVQFTFDFFAAEEECEQFSLF